jgi:Tissue inhibitor of metalloproteinase
MNAKYAAALLAALVLALTAQPARACSCVDIGPACQAFWKTDAVFDATVSAIESIGGTRDLGGRTFPFREKRVHLVVQKGWKGVEAGPLDVVTPGSGASCGYDFKNGGRYLIFAYRNPSDGRLQVSLCSATREYDGTGEAADFLESLAAPARGGRVFGKVTTGMRAFNQEHSYSETATETVVRLFGGGQERATRSTGGRYEFSGLAEGSYRIELQVPEGYTTYSTIRLVEIPNLRACREESFALAPAGRITGRIAGKDNRGLPRVQVEVTDPEIRAHPVYGLPIESSMIDEDVTWKDGTPAGGVYVSTCCRSPDRASKSGRNPRRPWSL